MTDKDIDNKEHEEFLKKQRKAMWVSGIACILIFLFLITYFVAQEAYAQSFFEIIENPESCERIRIFGEKAWLPFRLSISHPPTDQTVSHVSAVDKEKEERDVTANEGRFDFTTNEANTWTIGYQVTYGRAGSVDDPAGDESRSYTIEYASEQLPTQKETRRMNGNQICHIFEITTEEAPEFPVIDDLLTDVGVKSLQEMQFVVPAINTLDQTLGRNTFVIAVFIAVVLALIGFMFFKAKEFGETKLQTQRDILNATKNSNEQTELAKKAVDYIYSNLIPSIDNKIEDMMTKFEMEKNTILLDIKTALGVNKLKPEEKKGAKVDVNVEQVTPGEIKPILEPTPIIDHGEPIKEKKEITFANIPDIENIQDKSDIQDIQKEPKTLKEKITDPIKQVIDITINQATELPAKFKKSQPIFMGKNKDKVMIDYSEDQIIKPIKLKKLYMGNNNKINSTLYRKYWKLSQIYPNVDELSKRRDILRKILEDYAKGHEKRRQAEADLNSSNGEKE